MNLRFWRIQESWAYLGRIATLNLMKIWSSCAWVRFHSRWLTLPPSYRCRGSAPPSQCHHQSCSWSQLEPRVAQLLAFFVKPPLSSKQVFLAAGQVAALSSSLVWGRAGKVHPILPNASSMQPDASLLSLYLHSVSLWQLVFSPQRSFSKALILKQ